ncbi:transposase, partial [Roseomonas alkaliterrae]|uniref:transposase n=1 Tax=Neoroseomonas alkaliterrae TaxID=1452450 RepID=UPI001BAE09A0|nr:transposase [Neoroseomonas alkaliterrae]
MEQRLRELSAQGDPLEKLAATVDFEIFRAELAAGLGARDRAKGGRPAFDPVLKIRMLVLQAMHGLSLAQTEYLVADRLSWMRFCGLGDLCETRLIGRWRRGGGLEAACEFGFGV